MYFLLECAACIVVTVLVATILFVLCAAVVLVHEGSLRLSLFMHTIVPRTEKRAWSPVTQRSVEPGWRNRFIASRKFDFSPHRLPESRTSFRSPACQVS